VEAQVKHQLAILRALVELARQELIEAVEANNGATCDEPLPDSLTDDEITYGEALRSAHEFLGLDYETIELNWPTETTK
jgi:hypothetical protein